MRFDERADSYGAHAAPQKRFAEALAAFAPFRRGLRVTELGAGTALETLGIEEHITFSIPRELRLHPVS